MDPLLYKRIEGSSAHRLSRESNRMYILEDTGRMRDLIDVATNPQDHNHYKALMILDCVLEQQIELLRPYLDKFCNTLPQLRHGSAVRTASRICMMAVNHHLGEPDFLSDEHLQKIAEKSFDWMIDDSKVAVKAHAMRSLYAIGTFQQWIHAELLEILQLNFAEQSPGYKAAAKQIFKAVEKSRNRC